MPRQISFALAGGFLTLALGLGAPAALAAPPHQHHIAARHRSPRVYAAPEQRFAYRYPPEWGFEAGVPPNAVRGPGYIFVPGKGILGEPCDMPTSTCPNEYRDVQ